MKLLPSEGDDYQYRIKSSGEAFERVAGKPARPHLIAGLAAISAGSILRACGESPVQEGRMPIYITQGRYTRDAIKGMIVKPEDRADAVGRLLSKAGGRLIGYYLTFGEYDFLAIAEAERKRRWRRSCWRPAAVVG